MLRNLLRNLLPSPTPTAQALRLVCLAERKADWMRGELSLSELALLSRALAVVRLGVGSPLLKAGEEASFVALLLEGSLEVHHRPVGARAHGGTQAPVTRTLRPGTALGYVPLFQGGGREADVLGATPAYVGVISYAELSSLSLAEDAGARKLIVLLARLMYVHIKKGQLSGELTSELVGETSRDFVLPSRKLAPVIAEQEARDWPSKARCLIDETQAEHLYRRLRHSKTMGGALAAEVANSGEPLPPTFLCRVLLPEGASRLHTFTHEHSIGRAVLAVLGHAARTGGLGHGAGPGASEGSPSESGWVLQVPTTGEVLSSGGKAMLQTAQYVRSFLEHRRVPILRLCRATDAAEYRDALVPPLAEAEEVVHALLGHPLVWSSESMEVLHFRRAMMLLRPTVLAEYEATKVNRELPTFTDPTPPLATLPSRFLVKIFLLGQDIAKGYMATKSQKVSELRALAHGHYVRALKDESLRPEQMVLKFLGVNEYLVGGELIDYSTVRYCLKRSQEIQLRLLPHPWLSAPPLPPAPPPPASQHVPLPSLNVPFNPSAFPSVLALSPHTKLRIRIVALENMRAAAQLLTWFVKGRAAAALSTWSLHVGAALYHGGVPLCAPRQTSLLSADEGSNPQWNEWLTFDLPVCHAPQAGRACFTVYGRPASARREPTRDHIGARRELTPVPLGWVGLPLYDHENRLASGVYQLRLWPGAEANPIGAATENVSTYGSETPVLFVQFENFVAPLVLPRPLAVAEAGGGGGADAQRMPSPGVIKRLKVLIEQDPLADLTQDDKQILWTHRHFILSSPIALPKFLQSVSWADHRQVAEMHALLGRWAPLKPVAALELLDAKFADARIREYAVGCLEDFSDTDLELYVLQLVQVLKYEALPLAECMLIVPLIACRCSSMRRGTTRHSHASCCAAHSRRRTKLATSSFGASRQGCTRPRCASASGCCCRSTCAAVESTGRSSSCSAALSPCSSPRPSSSRPSESLSASGRSKPSSPRSRSHSNSSCRSRRASSAPGFASRSARRWTQRRFRSGSSFRTPTQSVPTCTSSSSAATTCARTSSRSRSCASWSVAGSARGSICSSRPIGASPRATSSASSRWY
jgi:hypothetical protein